MIIRSAQHFLVAILLLIGSSAHASDADVKHCIKQVCEASNPQVTQICADANQCVAAAVGSCLNIMNACARVRRNCEADCESDPFGTMDANR